MGWDVPHAPVLLMIGVPPVKMVPLPALDVHPEQSLVAPTPTVIAETQALVGRA